MAREGSVIDRLTKAEGTVLRAPRVRDFKDELGPVPKLSDDEAMFAANLDVLEGRTSTHEKNVPGGETVIPKTGDKRSTIFSTSADVESGPYTVKGAPTDKFRFSENIEDMRNDRTAESNFKEAEQAWLDVSGLHQVYKKKYGADQKSWPAAARRAYQRANLEWNEVMAKHDIDFSEFFDHAHETYPKTAQGKDIYVNEDNIREIRKDWPSKTTRINGWHREDE